MIPQFLAKAAGRQVWIISDIDGTLVPHPYFSGQDAAQRKSYVKRLAALCSHDRFSLMTGRMTEGYKRLFVDSDVPLVFPAALGLEFGSLLFKKDKLVQEAPPYAPLQKFVTKLESELRLEPRNLVDINLFDRMKAGKMTGFVRELKNQITQIEWYFDDPSLKKNCISVVHNHLNESLLDGLDFRFQFFESRIDLLQPGFIPKSCFDTQWFLGESFDPTHALIVALGDESYDSHMFRYLKTSFPDRVFCAAVHNNLKGADHVFKDELQALDFIESLLV